MNEERKDGLIYTLLTALSAVVLVLLGVSSSYFSLQTNDELLKSISASVGAALIGIVAVGLVYEFILRRSFLKVMESKVDDVIRGAVPGSIGSIRKAGVVAVYPELNFDRFKQRLLSEVRDTEVRILKMWIPGIHVLSGALWEVVRHRGCRVRILLLDPDAVEPIGRRANVIPDTDAETVRMNIVRNLRILESVRSRLGEDAEKFEVRLHRSFISMSLLGYGDTYVTGLYWNGKLSTEGPQLKISGCERYLFSAVEAHFRAEWSQSVDAFATDASWRRLAEPDDPTLALETDAVQNAASVR